MSKKEGKGFFKAIFIIFLILAIVGILFFSYIFYSKISNIEYKKVDESNLNVNNDLYNDVKDNVSLNEFNGIKTIALFGTDSRDTEDKSAGRADTIMIASINPIKKTIKLMSIPRDTYVSVDGYSKTKINHAYAYGQEELTIKTINSNFDLNISEFITIDFSGLINIINDVGGIEVEITKSEMAYINQRSNEAYSVSGNAKSNLTSSGKIILDGEQALTHSRNRTIGNDFTRAQRQRTVLEALITKLSTMDSMKLISLSDVFLKEITTNINFTNYIPMILSFLINKNDYLKNIESVQIPSTEYSVDKIINGTYYFVPNVEKTKLDFIKYIYEK